MKFSKSLILIVGLVLITVPVIAQTSHSNQTRSCSPATLKGNYGGYAEGVFLVPFPGTPTTMPYPGVAVGFHTFDGVENWSLTYAGSAGGLIIPWGAKAAGKYTVSTDCELTVEGTDEVTGLKDRFVGIIIGHGMAQEVRLTYTVPFMVTSATLRKTPSQGCSQQMVEGTYALFGQGWWGPTGAPLLPGAHVGLFTADGTRNFAGKETVALNGAWGQDTFTATYTVNSDCTFSAAVSVPSGVVPVVGIITGEGRSQVIYTIMSDSGWVFANTFKKR